MMDNAVDNFIRIFTPLLEAMVDNPENFKMKGEGTPSGTTLIQLFSHPEDVGKLIGKSGRNVLAIRQLMFAVGARYGYRVILEVVE